MTLIEVIIAMFILLVGVIGVMMAVPTGVSTASWVIFHDAAMHLSASKFSEFRRDRVNPLMDLVDGSTYMNGGALASGRPSGSQEVPNGNIGGWRDFAHASSDDTYYYFDDIERYEWKVDQSALLSVGPAAPTAANAGVVYGPQVPSATELNVRQVTVAIHLKGTIKELRFTEYMFSYDY